MYKTQTSSRSTSFEMRKSKFLACLRSILLLEKNGGDEKVVERNYYEVLGEDLRKIVTDFGYSGIGDPAFLEDHSDIIVSKTRK